MKIFLAIVVGLLLLGCTAPAETTTTTVAGETTTTVAETSTTLAQETTTTLGDTTTTLGSQTGATELASCISGARSWKVEYDMKANANGETTTAQFTQYFKNGKMRTDMTASGVETRTFIDGSNVNVCFMYGGSWTCQASQVNAQVNVDAEVSSNAASFQADGQMEVAGTTANCFKGDTEAGPMKYCITQECVPVFVSYEATDGASTVASELKASAYTTTVADADFTAPA